VLPTLILALSLSALASPDSLTVVVSGADVRTVELGCRDGTRVRRPPRAPRPGADPQVRFPALPSDECTLYFKGITPSRYGPVPQRGTLQCQLDGRVARCTVPADPAPPAPPSGRPDPIAAVSARTPAGRAASAGSAPSAPGSVTPAPGATAGALEITLLDAPGVTGFELTCRSGQRARAARPRDGTPARFGDVKGEGCRLNFRGTPPAIVHRVTPGTALRCEIKGVTALCETRPLGD
jgi:hypothetical protein